MKDKIRKIRHNNNFTNGTFRNLIPSSTKKSKIYYIYSTSILKSLGVVIAVNVFIYPKLRKIWALICFRINNVHRT